ncbi:MAG: gamma carbonic anhydrase family protein [Desulfobacter postgatei]|jgi:carbonic anhydrase/acetyltransferase-like protein (isoleucine patch superfamily)|uniref:gamma carbonic anhydrase family protein n=1 Tax=Desulfobacter postgatei TaxID=2293 RepID=UPI0023F32346|nr:gamma carbonic anhydrase family protein [Desulfobacter postgatei]MDD4272556.1 gamma carbonic anhydrase family protein [Desulfobacter postgatei]MDX9963925.1 gamma carbonic anhydrase family protein [Desulfobacter postgatei]
MTLYSYKNIAPEVHDSVFIAPGAKIIGDVQIGRDSSVWFQTVLRGDVAEIRIGERTNIQDLCMGHVARETPLVIGNDVTIGHNCCVHGCTIGDRCLIGMGAVLLNNSVIGEGCVIAAGTVVLEKTIIPPYSLVTGSPGKVKRAYENREEIDQMMKKASHNYLGHAREYSSTDLFYEMKK